MVSQQPCSPRVSPVPLLSQQAPAPVRVNCLPGPAPVPGMNTGGTGPMSTEITHRQKTTWLNTRKISKCVPLTCIWHSLVIIFTFPVPTVMSPFPFLILYFLISLSFPKSESQRCDSDLVTKMWLWFNGLFKEPVFKYLYVFVQRRRWHPTPVLLPGKSHGWRSLVGCSPWGC